MTRPGALVVARHLDGRVTKGYAVSFEPTTEIVLRTEPGGEVVRVPTGELKAVFFVKDLEGDPKREERRAFTDSQLLGKRIWVEFADSEQMAGWSQSFRRGTEGFYLFPADPESNIEMAYVFTHATSSVLVESAAEHAARAFRDRLLRRTGGRISPEDWDRFLRDPH